VASWFGRSTPNRALPGGILLCSSPRHSDSINGSINGTGEFNVVDNPLMDLHHFLGGSTEKYC